MDYLGIYLDLLDSLTRLDQSLIGEEWQPSQLATVRAHRATLREFRDYCWQQIAV